MRQRTIWTCFSIIGTSIFVLLSIISCDRGSQTDYRVSTSYIYKNLTSELVEIKLYNETDENIKNLGIEAGAEIMLNYQSEGPKNGIIGPFPEAIATVIKFEDSEKCVRNFFKIKNQLLYDNYSPAMQNSNNNILIYNIDQEELDAATPCP